MLTAQLRKQLVDLFSSTPAVDKVILFGSRARGDAEERSDIDLAVDAPNMDARQWLNMLDRMEQLDTLLPIDVIQLATASPELREKIKREGKTLYERNQGRSEPAKPRKRAAKTEGGA